MMEEELLMMGGSLSSENLKNAHGRYIQRNYDARSEQARRSRTRTERQIDRTRATGRRGAQPVVEEEEMLMM